MHEQYHEMIKKSEEFIDSIIKNKYCVGNEKSYQDVLERILKSIKSNTTPYVYNKIKKLLYEKKIIPAGSILSGVGSDIKCSLSNCYYIPIKSDSISGIFKALENFALTFSYRGGVGTDITILRPKNTKVSNSARFSSGSVSFLPLITKTVDIIGQNGRRGALLISQDIRHPDIIDFIRCKSDPEKVFYRNYITNEIPQISSANLSVKVTDDFMKAVINDKNWTFVYPDIKSKEYIEWDGDYDKWLSKGYQLIKYDTIKARDLFFQICESVWKCGDPGLIFIDTVYKWTPCSFDPKLKPRGVNPCGEQQLADFNNCLLSAFALFKYVKNPYLPNAEFDIDLFLNDISYGIKFLDLMSDLNLNKHPLKKQCDMDIYGKRVGLEITGVADTLAMINLKYGSDKANQFLDDIFFFKALVEIQESNNLAKEKGCAPCFKTKKSRINFINQPYMQRIFNRLIKNRSETFKTNIIKYGLRNAAFNTMGPCGSISIIADNCSNAIEPLYSISYKRKSETMNKTFDLVHYPILKYYGEKSMQYSLDTLKEKTNYITAYELNYDNRLKTQATIQKWIDSSVSSTINLANTSTVNNIYDIYIKAWKYELKGITIFRDKSKVSVLSIGDETEEKLPEKLVDLPIESYLNQRKNELSVILRSYRSIANWKGAKVYITIVVDNNNLPVEVFANIPFECGIDNNKNFDQALYSERQANWNTICRLCSVLLRLKTPLPMITKHLQKASPSMVELPSIIMRVLNRFIIPDEEKIKEIKENNTGGDLCPNCNQYGIITQAGCEICVLCGNSKCS